MHIPIQLTPIFDGCTAFLIADAYYRRRIGRSNYSASPMDSAAWTTSAWPLNGKAWHGATPAASFPDQQL
jgi:hypothetical protein